MNNTYEYTLGYQNKHCGVCVIINSFNSLPVLAYRYEVFCLKPDSCNLLEAHLVLVIVLAYHEYISCSTYPLENISGVVFIFFFFKS